MYEIVMFKFHKKLKKKKKFVMFNNILLSKEKGETKNMSMNSEPAPILTGQAKAPPFPKMHAIGMNELF